MKYSVNGNTNVTWHVARSMDEALAYAFESDVADNISQGDHLHMKNGNLITKSGAAEMTEEQCEKWGRMGFEFAAF